MLESIAAQTTLPLEVILVDQNPDDELKLLLAGQSWPFCVEHVHRPHDRGACLGRNTGWRLSRGQIMLFPDDDSWYPPGFLAQGMAIMAQTGADIVTGRSCDETGRTINGRFAETAGPIIGDGIWIRQQEWITFIRRDLLERIDGYDENIGIGGPSPWQAAEGYDLVLRGIAAGGRAWYDPTLFAHHEEMATDQPDERMIAKGRAYARGTGYVLHRHSRSHSVIAYWCGRSAFNTLRSIVRGNWPRARYFGHMTVGRLEGWLGRRLPPAMPVGFHEGDHAA
jgi:glycosyltransferase involved in cell wall biosynthesis